MRIKNNQIQYLLLYYKNYRIYFAAAQEFLPKENICQLQQCKHNLNWSRWNLICEINPSIINLPLNEIYKKIDSLTQLVPFI